MSITSALLSATSGLGAVARGTEAVASNIANAATDGYARREVLTSARVHAGGVQIDGIARMVNSGILAESRIASAGSGHAARISAFHATAETAVGIPGDAASISDRLAAFEVALIDASARPDDEIRLAGIASSAADLVAAINRMGMAAQNARTEAQAAIVRDVGRLNSGLAEIARLNRAITVETATGRDPSALADLRQREIDSIAEIIPLREVARDNGQIALFTAGGAALLDGLNPARITLPASPAPQPGLSAAAGDLAYLTIDGRTLSAHQMGPYGGGTLAASFEIRDQLAPALQSQADRLASDLAARFGSAGPDPGLVPGDPGLFTVQGMAVQSPDPGLAQRLSLNAAIDPAQGGEVWRLRDGLNAPARGHVGNATLIEGMIAALHQPQADPLDPGAPGLPLGDRVATLTAAASTARVRAGQVLAGHSAHDQALQHSLAADGVDTDRELERLLAFEQAYAANARVIKAADSMLDTILGI